MEAIEQRNHRPEKSMKLVEKSSFIQKNRFSVQSSPTVFAGGKNFSPVFRIKAFVSIIRKCRL